LSILRSGGTGLSRPPLQKHFILQEINVNTYRWCRYVLCACCALALGTANLALAQRVRFGAPAGDPAAADGGISVASQPADDSPSGGWTAVRSSASINSASIGTSTPSVYPPSPYTSSVPTYIYTAAPAPASPASSFPVSTGAVSPQWVATGFDPYQVASRPAAFSGTITSASAGGYILPQPMPRVPYYTQQPVAAGAPGQPYVVIPEPSCAAPPVVQSAPVVMTNPTSTTVGPAIMAPPPTVTGPAPYVVPQTIPTLAPPTAVPMIGPHCYGLADAIFFTRDARVGNQPLVLLDGNAATQSNVLLSTGDFHFPFEVGPRVLLGREFDGFRAFEASYFGIYNWKDTSTINGDNDLNLPGDLGLAAGLNFFDADRAVVEYQSLIHNAELNYLQSYGNISWLLGFRYFNLQDKLSLTFTDVQTGTSAYKISAYNNLFGGQLGGRVQQACGNWSYDLTGKAGVYGNIIKSSQNVSDFDAFPIRNTRANGDQVAFIGDLELNGNYQFTPTWSLRGGYQVFWIEGLALAPNQLDFTDTTTSGTTLNKTGGMFMHGAHAGLMAKW
jgi:hypothetical protein